MQTVCRQEYCRSSHIPFAQSITVKSIVAGKESAGVTELAESLCEAGYSPSLLIRVINSALMIQAKEHPVTIDLTVKDRKSVV